MNTVFTSLSRAPDRVVPAQAGARWRYTVGRAGHGLWKLLEAVGRARAHRHLQGMADRVEALQPGLARELRAASLQGPMA